MRFGLTCVVTLTMVAGFAQMASAAPVCSTFASANGSSTFPGTNVGTVGVGAGQTCQIGDLSIYNSGYGGAFVPNGATPSIYSFYFGGGVLSVTEQIGNNGYPPNGINANFDLLALATSTSPSTTLASTTIPFSYGPSGPIALLGNVPLAAGYYAIQTSLAGGSAPGPNYQINFAVPEPATAALLLIPALAAIGRRRRQVA